MAGRNIKGITVEIGGDTTKLSTALEGVNSKIKNTQAQLRDVEKLLKFDPGNTELLAQKHKLLADAVSETKQKLETLETAAKQANEALAKGEISKEQYDALQREIVETKNELERLETAANQSATAVQKIAAQGEKLKTLGDNISGVGEKFLPATAAVVGLGTAAVKTAADFDTGMSKVAAISGATGDDLDALRAKAREMGAKTKFSASEAASAFEYMAMAGWKTGDMLDGIEGIMSLAAASGEDLATTSDIVTDALTAFGMSAQESGHFADILAAASSNANTNVSMMGETFKYAAPVAGALGYSAEDTALAIGLMANAGIKASQAGTAIRSGLTRLVKPTKQVQEAMDKYGISITDSNGRMYTLEEMMLQLREKLGGLSEAEQGAAAAAIFGTNAMSGWLAIINGSDEDFNKLSNAIDNCDGTSEQMAATMQDNLAGQLTILKSQLEELAISFGEILMPAIRSIVTWIQGVVDKLNSLDPATKKTITTIALVVAAIGPVLIAVGKVISAVGTIMTLVPKISGAISAVKGAMSGLHAVMAANPIGVVIAAIAALVAAFIYLWNNCEEFREFWINLWEKIKAAAEAVWEAITTFFSNAWNTIKEIAETVFTAIATFFTGLWQGIGDTASSIWNGITEGLTNIWNGIKNTAETVWNGIKSGISTVTDAISTTVQGKWDNIKSAYEQHGGGLKGIASATIEAVKGYFTAGFDFLNNLTGGKLDGIKTAVSNAMNAIKAGITTAWNNIKAAVSTALNNIKTAVTSAWNNVKTSVSTTHNNIKTAVTSAWNNVKTSVTSALNNIKTAVTTAWNNIKTGISTALNNIKSAVSSAWTSIKSTVQSLMQGISSSVTSIWNNMRSGIANTISGIGSTIQSGLSNAANLVRNVASSAWNWGKDIVMGIVNGIKSCMSSLTSAVSNLAAKIRSFLHFSVPDEGPLADYESWMPDFMSGLANGIEKSRGLVQKAIGGVAEDMVVSPNITGPEAMTERLGQNTTDNSGLMSLLSQYLPYLPQLANMQLVTDTGTLVGELAPQMDQRLGILALRQRRQ